MINIEKPWNEQFAQFFESPSRESLRNLLRDHLGETHAFDFKEIWPSNPKLSKHILGLANYGGGCLIFGVKENKDKSFDLAGLRELSEKTDIQKGVAKYIPPQLKYTILNFSYENSEYIKLIGKKYQVLIVEDFPKYLPFIATADGEGIRKNAIYYRYATNTEEINYDDLQNLINKRIETEFSTKPEFDLQKHLDQLKVLYRNIEPVIENYHGERFFENEIERQIEEAERGYSWGANPNYPEESFEVFVKKLITEKKKLINILTTNWHVTINSNQ